MTPRGTTAACPARTVTDDSPELADGKHEFTFDHVEGFLMVAVQVCRQIGRAGGM